MGIQQNRECTFYSRSIFLKKKYVPEVHFKFSKNTHSTRKDIPKRMYIPNKQKERSKKNVHSNTHSTRKYFPKRMYIHKLIKRTFQIKCAFQYTFYKKGHSKKNVHSQINKKNVPNKMCIHWSLLTMWSLL